MDNLFFFYNHLFARPLRSTDVQRVPNTIVRGDPPGNSRYPDGLIRIYILSKKIIILFIGS